MACAHSKAEWFIKADDDTYVNIPYLKDHLQRSKSFVLSRSIDSVCVCVCV